jgi:hypothetical protein
MSEFGNNNINMNEILIKIIDKIKIGINCENSFKMSKISASNMI